MAAAEFGSYKVLEEVEVCSTAFNDENPGASADMSVTARLMVKVKVFEDPKTTENDWKKSISFGIVQTATNATTDKQIENIVLSEMKVTPNTLNTLLQNGKETEDQFRSMGEDFMESKKFKPTGHMNAKERAARQDINKSHFNDLMGKNGIIIGSSVPINDADKKTNKQLYQRLQLQSGGFSHQANISYTTLQSFKNPSNQKNEEDQFCLITTGSRGFGLSDAVDEWLEFGLSFQRIDTSTGVPTMPKSHVVFDPKQLKCFLEYFGRSDSILHRHFPLSVLKNSMQNAASLDVEGNVKLAHMLNCSIPSTNPIGQHFIRQQNGVTTFHFNRPSPAIKPICATPERRGVLKAIGNAPKASRTKPYSKGKKPRSVKLNYHDTTDGVASEDDSIETSEVLHGASTATQSGGSVPYNEDDFDTDTEQDMDEPIEM